MLVKNIYICTIYFNRIYLFYDRINFIQGQFGLIVEKSYLLLLFIGSIVLEEFKIEMEDFRVYMGFVSREHGIRVIFYG